MAWLYHSRKRGAASTRSAGNLPKSSRSARAWQASQAGRGSHDCKGFSSEAFLGPFSKKSNSTGSIKLSSPNVPRFISPKVITDRKMSLCRVKSPRATQVKIVILNDVTKLATRSSIFGAAVAFAMDLRKNVTKESSEYWYMWSTAHMRVSMK